MVDRNGLADNCIFKHVRFRGLSFAGHTSYDYTSAFELRYSRNFRKFAGIAAGGDVLRYMMYYNSYSDHERAKELFANLPTPVRSRLENFDYSLAEKNCPQGIAIGSLMRQAAKILA